MTFADLVEEVRTLPVVEKEELKSVLEQELTEAVRQEFYLGHLEARRLWDEGALPTPTSDVDELIRRLEAE
jgi:hypothetical protein